MKIYNDRPDSWFRFNKAGILVFLFFIVFFSSFFESSIHLYTDTQNSRTVSIRSKDIKFRLKDNNYNTLNQIPAGDFQIVTTDLNDTPFVGDVRDSSVRWGGSQRAETYVEITTAIEKSKECGIIKVDVSGLKYNYPIIGKSYPVVKEVRTGC
jgi:hypothetical protein